MGILEDFTRERDRVPDSILELTETLYDAVTGKCEWINSFEQLCDLFDMPEAFVTDCDAGGNLRPGLGTMTAEELKPYFSRWKGADPRSVRFTRRARTQKGRIFTDRDIFTPAELLDSEFHQLMRTRGHSDFLGFSETVGGRDYFFVGAVPLDKSTADIASPDLVRAVGRHFIRAISTWRELQQSAALSESLLFTGQSEERGIIVLDHNQRLLHMNAKAASLLEGQYLISSGRLRLRERSWQDSLAQLTAAATAEIVGTPLGPIALPRDASHLPLLATVTPLPAEAAGEAGKRMLAMVSIVDLAQSLDPAEIEPKLRALGLTPFEARVGVLIGAAYPAAEVAATLAITESTVRSTVAAIYAKLGMVRQTQLVQLVTRLS